LAIACILKANTHCLLISPERLRRTAILREILLKRKAGAMSEGDAAMAEASGAAETIFDAGGDASTVTLKLKIKHGKDLHELEVKETDTIDQLKDRLMDLTNVPPAMQKLMFKGKLEGATQIKDTKLKDGSKVMLIGNPISTLLEVSKNEAEGREESKSVKSDLNESEKTEEPLCDQLPHKTHIKDGPPKEAVEAKAGQRAPLPADGLKGILGHSGKPVRITFPVGGVVPEMRISSNERTQKIPLAQIRAVKKEEKIGDGAYWIVSLQMGENAKSKFYLYFMPDQFFDAFRTRVLYS
jgi:hypothetical protein